jgi:hypothetical protein
MRWLAGRELAVLSFLPLKAAKGQKDRQIMGDIRAILLITN